MNPDQRITELELKVSKMTDLFYRIIQIDKAVFNQKVILNKSVETDNKDGISFGKLTDLLSVYGVTPVAQAGAVTAPVGGATIDVESRIAINQIITALKDYGITQ